MSDRGDLTCTNAAVVQPDSVLNEEDEVFARDFQGDVPPPTLRLTAAHLLASPVQVCVLDSSLDAFVDAEITDLENAREATWDECHECRQAGVKPLLVSLPVPQLATSCTFLVSWP